MHRRRQLFGMVALVVLGLFASGCTNGSRAAGAGDVNSATARSAGVAPQSEGVTVSGMGRVTGTPDVLRAAVGVEVTRPDVQAALDEANAAAEEVMSALQASGVAEEDIQTVEFSVSPEYRHEESRAPEVTGYRVTNIMQAKIRDLGQVGQILADAIAAGGDNARVQHVSFALEDNDALLEAARVDAFADARRKAEQYADLAERDLGDLISVSEVTADPPPPVPFAADDAAMEAAGGRVPIASGQQEVVVTVTAVWVLL